MTMPLGMLIAYDADGTITATLDELQRTLPDGRTIRIDFASMEAAGEKLRLRREPLLDADGNPVLDQDGTPLEEEVGVWNDPLAVGSAVWPEWLGDRVAEFKVRVDKRYAHPLRELIHVGLPPRLDTSTGETLPAMRGSGQVRKRETLEAEVERRIAVKGTEARDAGKALRAELIAAGIDEEPVLAFVTDPEPVPADIRDLVGGPYDPILLDEQGEVVPPRRPAVSRLEQFALSMQTQAVEQHQPVDGGGGPETGRGVERPPRALAVGESE